MKKPRQKTNILEEFAKTHQAIERWHSRTSPEYRTIDNLQSYLTRNRKILFTNLGTSTSQKTAQSQEYPDFLRRSECRYLASYFYAKKLDFKLTPLAVDAILRPTHMYDLEHYGYEFFLHHFHEHPLLEEKIMASINTPARLRIIPVFPADTDFMAWLFDPNDMKTYIFHANAGSKRETNIGLRKEHGRIRSIGALSIFEEYSRKDTPVSDFYRNPFSDLYRKKVKKYKELEAISLDNKKRYKQALREFSRLVRKGKTKP